MDAHDGERAGRWLLVVYAIWSAIVGAWGRTAPLFPAELREAFGYTLAAVCLVVAVWPSPGRYRWAFGLVFTYGIWSALRVLAADLASTGSAVAASAYAAIGASALVAGALVAVLGGITEVADGAAVDER